MNYQPPQTAAYDFPVEMIPGESFRIFGADGKEMHMPSKRYQAVARADTGDILTIHGGRYALNTHADLVAKTDAVLQESGLDLDHIRVKDRVFENGCKLLREITFPNLVVSPQVGDTVEFRISMRNSYDGSWQFGLDAGARRLICLNGMTIAGLGSVRSRKRHTTTFNLDGEARMLGNALEAFRDSEGVWRTWAERTVTEERVKHLWESTLARTPTPSNPVATSGKLMDQLITNWNKQSRTMGSTAWTAYNVATAWATHGDTKGRAHDVQMRRDEQVSDMVKSDAWAELIS